MALPAARMRVEVRTLGSLAILGGDLLVRDVMVKRRGKCNILLVGLFAGAVGTALGLVGQPVACVADGVHDC